jgi:hypothetical protein
VGEADTVFARVLEAVQGLEGAAGART